MKPVYGVIVDRCITMLRASVISSSQKTINQVFFSFPKLDFYVNHHLKIFLCLLACNL